MKSKKTWILIANRGEARIFLNEGRGDGVHRVDGMNFQNEILPAKDIMADKQGRAFDRVGGGRHAMEYASDPAEQADAHFARHLGEILHQGLAEHSCDRLVVVAAPSMLARLRQAMTPDTRANVHAEIAKDYTKTPLADLAGLLRRAEALD